MTQQEKKYSIAHKKLASPCKIKTYPSKSIQTYLPNFRNLTIEAVFVVGLSLLLIGFAGIFWPQLMSFHMSILRSLFYIFTGSFALWFALEKFNGSKLFCYVYGFFFGTLGLLGFLNGSPSIPAVGYLPEDPFLWRLLPHNIELGVIDHFIHLLLAFILFWGAQISIALNKKEQPL